MGIILILIVIYVILGVFYYSLCKAASSDEKFREDKR